MRLCPASDRGFTLLETLTAIFIFSLLTVSCNAIFSLIRKNAAAQTDHNQTTLVQQRAVTLLVADLLQAEVSVQNPLTLLPRQTACRKTLTLFTRNLANPKNQFSGSLHRVIWTFSEQGVTRAALLEEGENTVKMLPTASCFDFSAFSSLGWQRPDILENTPRGLAFNLTLSPRFHIERFIPTGVEPATTTGGANAP